MKGRLGPCSWLAVLALGLSGCIPGDDADLGEDVAGKMAPAVSFDNSWVLAIAADPTAINGLLSSNPNQGWQLLYQQKYADASAAFEGPSVSDAIGRARAELAMANLYKDAHTLSLALLVKMSEGLAENADRIKESPAMGYFAATVALQSGEYQTAQRKAQAFMKAFGGHPLADAARALVGAAKLASGDDSGNADLKAVTTADGKALAAAWARRFGGEAPIPPVEGLSLYGKRARVYALAADGQLAEATRLAASLEHKAADFVETVGEGEGATERKHYDPLILDAMAQLHGRAALAAVEGKKGLPEAFGILAKSTLGLPPDGGGPVVADGPMSEALWPALAFGPYPTPGDLAATFAPLAGGAAPGAMTSDFLAELGPVSQKSDQGRQVRQAQDLGKAWENAMLAQIKALPQGEGVSMVQGLQLGRGLIAHLLRARARQLISAGKALEGLALLEYTFEKEKSSEITYINDPGLFLETTNAYCRIDRYREALNYLYRLVDSYPQLWSVYEVLGNLSVLDTLDRTGVDGQ